MEMIELVIKYACAIVVSIYYISRFGKYIDGHRNNNVTGSILYRWESVSIIDRYHLRERLLGGSKLRIKRDAKRHEIKYNLLNLIPALIFVLTSVKLCDVYTYVAANICFIFMMKVLFDKIENGKRLGKVITGITEYFITAVIFILLSGKIINVTDLTFSKKDFYIKEQLKNVPFSVYLPLIILLVITIYGVIKKKIISLIICIYTLIASVIAAGFSNDIGAGNYILIYYAGYLYVSMLIMQSIYNVRALKKITFIN